MLEKVDILSNKNNLAVLRGRNHNNDVVKVAYVHYYKEGIKMYAT